MAATADSFLHLVISYDTSAKSLALQRRVIVRGAVQNSHVRQLGTDTWRMKSASLGGRQTPTGS